MNIIDLSTDGRWLVASDDQVWLEDGVTGAQRRLPLGPRAPFALDNAHLWTVCDDVLGYFDLEHGDRWIAFEPCLSPIQVLATPLAVAAVCADHVLLVRRRSPAVLLPTSGDARIWLTGSRWLLVGDARGAGWVDLAAPTPAITRVGLSARVLDATSLVDDGSALLLLDRGDHQELAIVRRPATVLRRIRVRGVVGVRGAASGFQSVLLTDDHRAVICDLRGRDVEHVLALGGDHADARISADGVRVVAAARGRHGLEIIDSGAPAFSYARAA